MKDCVCLAKNPLWISKFNQDVKELQIYAIKVNKGRKQLENKNTCESKFCGYKEYNKKPLSNPWAMSHFTLHGFF